jgi:ketosteroid isomerase-like protein
MSRENVEIVREIFEAAARRDRKRVLALYDPDVVMDGSRFGDGTIPRPLDLAWLRGSSKLRARVAGNIRKHRD